MRSLTLRAEILEIVLGLLFGGFGGTLGIRTGTQEVDGLVQTPGLLSVRGLASGHISTRMHAGDTGAEAIEIQSKIVTGVERGEALIQRGERGASLRGIRVGRQNSLRLQFGRQFFLDVAAAAVRINGLFRIFLHPLDGIQRMGTMRALLRRGRSTGPGRPLCRGVLRTNGDERGQTHGYDYNSKQISFHVYLTRAFWDAEETAGPGLAFQ